MQRFSLGIEAQINGIYLNSETIELLSIVQCNTIEELKYFVRSCSQFDISDQEIENWNTIDIEIIKKNLAKKYKDTLIPMEESIKDRINVIKYTLEHSGILSEEIHS